MLKPINKILNFAGHSKKIILTSTVIAVIAASIAIPHVRFDYNLLNMNNPHAESVTTFQELLKNPDDSPWHIEILADNLTELKQLKERLEKLSQVKTVVSILDLVPENQQEKIELITEMSMTIGPISLMRHSILTRSDIHWNNNLQHSKSCLLSSPFLSRSNPIMLQSLQLKHYQNLYQN